MEQVSPSVPRKAATLLVVRDDPFEVLMLRRHAGATFPSAMVFPGGVVEASDGDEEWLPHLIGAGDLDAEERAYRIAALRETWEEASIVVARRGGSALPDSGPFRDVVGAGGGVLELDRLQHFGHWLTPDVLPKRFDTRFYLAEVDRNVTARFDGGETVSVEWLSPEAALARAAAGDRMLFPTRMNLKRLAESSTVAEALAAAALRPFYAVLPIVVPTPDGGRMLRIPAEAGYGVTEDFQSIS